MIWQDRTRTDPTKRKFIDENGNEQNVNIEEIQSNITQSGTPVNATTMNNIEKNLGTYGNDTYDSTATYSIGDVVTHNALLYRAKQDIETPEEWTAAHWEETSALDELKKTSGNEVLISDDEGDITYQTKIFVDSDTGTAKYRDTNDSFVPLKDNEVIISDTEPTSADNELWVDTSSNATYINSEISNEYGTSQNLGYSQEYINDTYGGISLYSSTSGTHVAFTLSEDIKHFREIEVTFGRSSWTNMKQKVRVVPQQTGTTPIGLIALYPTTDGNSLVLASAVFEIGSSGTNAQFPRNTSGTIGSTGFVKDTATYVNVYEVVGYK